MLRTESVKRNKRNKRAVKSRMEVRKKIGIGIGNGNGITIKQKARLGLWRGVFFPTGPSFLFLSRSPALSLFLTIVFFLSFWVVIVEMTLVTVSLLFVRKVKAREQKKWGETRIKKHPSAYNLICSCSCSCSCCCCYFFLFCFFAFFFFLSLFFFCFCLSATKFCQFYFSQTVPAYKTLFQISLFYSMDSNFSIKKNKVVQNTIIEKEFHPLVMMLKHTNAFIRHFNFIKRKKKKNSALLINQKSYQGVSMKFFKFFFLNFEIFASSLFFFFFFGVVLNTLGEKKEFKFKFCKLQLIMMRNFSISISKQ